jgi:hypothetical protein
VDGCALVAQAIVEIDLDRVPDVACQGRARPLSVDTNERPLEAVRRCRDPSDIPVVGPKHALGKRIARICGIKTRA